LTEPVKTAYVFPGQGSQSVGMGLDLYRNYEAAQAVFEQADRALGFPISKLCFEGPEEELVQTVNAQPAIVTVSFACLEAARSLNRGLPQASFVAGHSLGEYAALAAAGVLDFPTAVYLARERGRLMHEAGELTPGGMAAIIGLDQEPLAEVCQQTGARIANINCPGQIVISGAKDKLAKAMEMVKERGAYRVIPLQVSGAFHTELMQPAVDGMAQVMANLKFNDPTIPIIGNTSAKPLTTAGAVKEELLAQLCKCVQWQRSIEYMIKDGVSAFFEIGPGRVLAGLIKRIDRSVRIINIGDAEAVKNIAQGVR
jgi:[acyl-carrier-protein] S-malonyltransferase